MSNKLIRPKKAYTIKNTMLVILNVFVNHNFHFLEEFDTVDFSSYD